MGASCQLVEKACYRKICRDGSISALRAAAMRRLRSETRLRAQSRAPPSPARGMRHSRYVVLLVRQHGTVKTVPYKQTDRPQMLHKAKKGFSTV